MRLEHPKSGKLQQGALFNCVLVSGYEGCPCHGLVLTARCDLEHGKYSVINYLPVVDSLIGQSASCATFSPGEFSNPFRAPSPRP